ncbi:DUF5723 family protein [Tellurirhabdus bombi]|uniref:DUF5723 family protein n=1 Tax=Tellurirhabdus bombi TaxID=2907205 RepID=UPI001F251C00|nr:DUF5723 family protein [Tellurirhabdus bombi]
MNQFRLSLSVLTLLTSFAFSAQAQFVPGLSSSNYGGLYRVLQNPSAAAGSRYRFQIIPAAGMATINPVVFKYLVSDDYMGTLRLPYSNQLARDLRAVGSLTDAPNTNSYSELIGPSALIRFGGVHGLALHTRMRNYVYGTSLPEPLTEAYRRGLGSRVLQPASGNFAFNLTNESYAEAGLTYGLVVFDGQLHRLRIGATGRRIVGAQRQSLNAAGGYAIRDVAGADEKALDFINAQYLGSYTVARQSFSLSGGYGTGWAYDLGATYEIGYNRSGKTFDPHTTYTDDRPAYLLRLSASVMNGGSIKYPGSQAFAGSLSQSMNQETLDAFGNNPVDYLVANSTLPPRPSAEGATTVSLQRQLHLEADLRVMPAIYINAIKTTSITDGPKPLPDLFIITPRFEDEDAELAFPVSIIGEDKKVAVGMSARLGPISLGMSDLNHFINKKAENRSTLFWVGLSFWGK